MAATEINSNNYKQDSNLKAYWRFEGDSNDSADSHNGADTAITYGAGTGKFTQGAAFASASPSYITVPRHADFEPTEFTVCGWIKSSAAQQQMIINNYNGSGADYKGFYLVWYALGHLGFYVGKGGTTGVMISTWNTGYNDGNWHHIAITMKNNDFLRIYVDGVIAGDAGAITTAAYDATIALIMGTIAWGAGGAWNLTGVLDDFAFFNRQLGAIEIAYLALGNKPNSPFPAFIPEMTP